METLTAAMVGLLVAASLYLILRRNAFSLAIGLIILAHAVNLLLFAAGGLQRGAVPVIEGDTPGAQATQAEPGATAPPADPVADPLPQALILTAIVIGLGIQAFVLVLVYRLIDVMRTADLAEARTTEPGDAKPPSRSEGAA